MTLQKFNIDLPSVILLTLNESEEELKKTIKSSLDIRLYTQQKITLGKAAQIAEVSRLQFENLLADNQIPISNLSVQEVLNDIEKLR
jgi:predicted HTH domain antitoxin